MKSLNEVRLIGNLTRDPEIKALEKSDSCLVTFGLAMNRVWYNKQDEKQEEVCFVDCIAWGKTGESFEKYHKKGDAVYVSGRLQWRQWEDKQGNKRSGLELVVEDFIIIKPWEDNGNDRGSGKSNRGSNRGEGRGESRAPSRGSRRNDDEDGLEEGRDPSF